MSEKRFQCLLLDRTKNNEGVGGKGLGVGGGGGGGGVKMKILASSYMWVASLFVRVIVPFFVIIYE